MTRNDDIKQVADAIANRIDHGDDCACSSCQIDDAVIADNSDIASALSSFVNSLFGRDD